MILICLRNVVTTNQELLGVVLFLFLVLLLCYLYEPDDFLV